MKAPNFTLPKNRLTFPISVVILLSVFFIGYYFYYVPVNKEDIYKNGFLILENIKKSIQEKNKGLKTMCKGYLAGANTKDKQVTTTGIQNLLNDNNVKGIAFNINKPASILNLTFLPDSFFRWNGADDIMLNDVINGNLVYISAATSKDSIGIAIPFDSIAQTVLQPQKNELFESYILLDKKGLIYKDPKLGIGENIFRDSLFSGNKTASFTSVKDIEIEGIVYKMFTYPLKLGSDEIVLCGFVKAKAYNARLHEIPVSFIYPIVIIFLLLVIFLPIIKFYIMGPDEHVRFIDITLGSLSFFVGAPLITLTLIQVLMLWAADIRAEENLEKLSNQIDSSFRKELAEKYRQLSLVDSLVAHDLNSTEQLKLKQGENLDISDSIRNYYLNNIKDTALYYDLGRFSWIDKSGRQRIKSQSTGVLPVFVNVSERKYFKTLQNNQGYTLPDHPGSTFAFEPVNNWVNSEFQIIISKKSIFDKDYYTSLSGQMHSVIQTILPPGYGFCIIDKAGEVQLHAEMNRNLQENIVEKIAPSRPVSEAINSRQQAYFNDVRFYGKTNALNIQAIAETPFYLITFCDKGYIVPINMRVFSFALVFSFFTFLICALIWIAVFRNNYFSYPMLYSPMVFLKWIIPREGAVKFYVLGVCLLCVYIIMLVLFMSLAPHFNLSDYIILVLMLLFPVNVISGLFVLSHSITDLNSDSGDKKISWIVIKVLAVILFQLLLSFAIYFYSESKGYPIGKAFLFFQTFINLLLWLIYLSGKKLLLILPDWKKRYMAWFCGLASLLIICMAALPAGIYTWYAHNQEITQSIKKEQLSLAESLQKRKEQINQSISERDVANSPDNFYHQLLYHTGIYKIYNDSINENADEIDGKEKKDSYEKFYFTVANDIGNNYYDPLLLPSLQDSAKDNAWHWSRHDTTLSFWYNLNQDVHFKGINHNAEDNTLNIISVYPDRYKYTGPSVRGMLLFAFVAFLLIGLFQLLKSLTERIFLKKFICIATKNKTDENKVSGLFQKFVEENNSSFDKMKNDILVLENEYNIYVPGGTKEEIYDKEKQMIDSVEKLKPFYEFIWQKCSDKEKYLMLDFAQDGLANYKNTAVIYSLLKTGIFIIADDEVKFFSASFRAYLLTKKNTGEIYELQKAFRQNSAWQSFRRPLLIVLLGVALFIFFTQEQTFQKIMALVAGISSVSSLLVKFFIDGSNNAQAAKK